MLTAVNSPWRVGIAPWARAGCIALGLAGRAHADAAPDEPRQPPSSKHFEQRLDFQAGRIDADGDGKRLILSQGVVLASGRYRLVSDRLVLCRTPDGVHVAGSGDLRFCPCEAAPLSVGFSGATLRAGDLIVSDPTLRLARVPVFWLPELRLRAPDRVGLLPPRLAWRGPDGVLAGTGVHFPFARSDDGVDALDVRVSGYVKRGVEVEARLATARTSTAVRWDHLRESMLAIDAHGAASRPELWTVAYRVDALRGPRALRASGSLEEVARRYDHALFSAGHASNAVQLAAGGWLLSSRGGAFDELGALGPFLSLGVGDALGRFAAASASLTVSTADDAALGAETRAEQRGLLEANAAAGPIGVGLTFHEAVRAQVRERPRDAPVLEAAVGTSLEASWPLARDYGAGPDPLQHRIEPFTRASFGIDFDDSPPERALFDEHWGAVLGGVRTALGRYAARQAGSLALQAGILGGEAGFRRAVASRAVLDADWWAVSGEAAGVVQAPANGLGLLRVRLGSHAAPHVSGYLEGRGRPEAERLRVLFDDYWDAPETRWFDRAGWSAGSLLHVPWATWLASSVGADYDVSAEELLGVRGALAYRHPCGCLAAVASAAERLGRSGVDVAFTLDLTP